MPALALAICSYVQRQSSLLPGEIIEDLSAERVAGQLVVEDSLLLGNVEL